MELRYKVQNYHGICKCITSKESRWNAANWNLFTECVEKAYTNDEKYLQKQTQNSPTKHGMIIKILKYGG